MKLYSLTIYMRVPSLYVLAWHHSLRLPWPRAGEALGTQVEEATLVAMSRLEAEVQVGAAPVMSAAEKAVPVLSI
jgi:hypothetical protein